MAKKYSEELIEIKYSEPLRWSLVAVGAISLWLYGQPWFIILLITCLGIVANLLIAASKLKKNRSLRNDWFVISIAFLFCGLLVISTGNEASPYFAILFLLVILSSYYYSYSGALYSSLLVNLLLINMYSKLRLDFRDVNVMLGLLATGLLIAKINQSKNSQIAKLQRLSRRISQDDMRLSSVVNSISDAVILVDGKGVIIRYNGAALDLIDTHLEIEGKKIDDLLTLRDKNGKKVKPTNLAIIHGKQFISDDLEINHGETKIALHVTVTPVIYGKQNRGAVFLGRDITDQKTLDAQKDEFLSIISHELRTPVAIVEADLSTVLAPKFAKLPDKVSRLLRTAYNNLTYLSNLLQDLSSLSQADRSIIKTEVRPIDSRKLIEELVRDFRSKAAEANLTINLKASRHLPVIVNSEGRIREILVNYLTNAIKYGADGKTIDISVSGGERIIDSVKFAVRDHGLGIDSAEQKHLFGKFYRTDKAKQSSIQGTGMGLYITKKQADKLGAEVWFESRAGRGSTFYLEVANKVKN